MKITSLAPENRPRERLQQQGPAALSDAELLAIILKSGTQKENVLDICHSLCSKYGLSGLSTTTLQELQQEHGIGVAKASQLIAVFELHKRTKKFTKDKIEKVSDVVQKYQNLTSLQQEQVIALYLDTKGQVITDSVVTIGTLDSSLIHPREVFHGAIKNLAKSLILIHNHPSGDSKPSEEDINITKTLASTGNMMGIPLIDHIIIGNDNYWSWKESHIH